MFSTTLDDPTPAGPVVTGHVASLVEAIGQDQFGPRLAQFLHQLCGADQVAGFRFEEDDRHELIAFGFPAAPEGGEPSVQQGWWKFAPGMSDMQRDATVRVQPHGRDRVVLCSRSTKGALGLSMLRSDPQSPFAREALDKVGECASFLMALLSKHADLCQARPNAAKALTVLPHIEACILSTNQLPKREVEVCARILYGMSTVGIALDLNVSEETVKTYRKRAYHRLAIGCERELLTWYLGHWSGWTHEPGGAALH